MGICGSKYDGSESNETKWKEGWFVKEDSGAVFYLGSLTRLNNFWSVREQMLEVL
jgi:hypothetical protein